MNQVRISLPLDEALALLLLTEGTLGRPEITASVFVTAGGPEIARRAQAKIREAAEAALDAPAEPRASR